VIRFDRVDGGDIVLPSTRVIAVRPAVGTRIERIEVLPPGVTPAQPEPAPVLPRPELEGPRLPDVPAVRNVPPDATPAPRGASSFEERLRPAQRTPELWRRPSPIQTPSDPETAARARLAGRIDAYNDSVALAAAEAARAVDWTRTDADGGRWGVSPEGIHLGDITIPVPINFSAGPGKRDEVAGRVRDWGEIQSQGARVEGKETFEERVRAIRERKERERAQDPPSEKN
jgi:hypothetical protein